jgi:hypothetical protein
VSRSAVAARPLLFVLLVAAAARPAAAQDEPATRAEILYRQRAEKAERLAPPDPPATERVLLALENDRLLERLLNPAQGFYPKIGPLTPGSDFAYGPAYRQPELFGGHADFAAFAAASFERYWMVDVRLTLPRLADGNAFAELNARRYDFPNEDFFGLGPDSQRDAHVLYGLQNTEVGAGAGVRPVPWFSLGGRIDYLLPTVSGGGEGRSIEQLFGDREAPGLAAQPDFLRTEARATVNYRRPLGNPRSGGRYTLALQRYQDRDLDRYSFTRFEAEVQQYISLLRNRRVLALRGLAVVSDTAAGQEIPFFLQPTLGGPDDLRGFRRFRFRDRHALLLQAEYRWEIFTAVDGALFYDAGKVASRVEDLTLDGLESNYGIGFRFGTSNGVFLRIEGAFGSRGGKHFVFTTGHVF